MKRLIFLVFITILSGCGQGKNSHQSRESLTLETGFEMIDQGRYEYAIHYFQRVYQAKPTDDALKAWASAYVARAGLKVSDLYKAFSTFPKENKLSQDPLLVQIETYRKSLEQIPYVKGEAREDLQSATAILKARNSSTVRLFRGILNLVLLRSTFSDGDKLLLDADLKVDLDKDLKVICKIEWRKLRTWLQAWTLYGIELKQDLDFAFPSKKKDWQDGEKFFLDARKLSTTLVRSCEP